MRQQGFDEEGPLAGGWTTIGWSCSQWSLLSLVNEFECSRQFWTRTNQTLIGIVPQYACLGKFREMAVVQLGGDLAVVAWIRVRFPGVGPLLAE